MNILEINSGNVALATCVALLRTAGWTARRWSFSPDDGEAGLSDPEKLAMRAYWNWLDSEKVSEEKTLASASHDLAELLSANPAISVVAINGDDARIPYADLAAVAADHGCTVAVMSRNGLESQAEDEPSSEFTITHRAGIAYFTPSQVDDPELTPPRGVPVFAPSMAAGLAGAVALMTEHYGQSGVTGEAPAQTVDLALADVVASFTFANTSSVQYDGVEPTRSFRSRPSGLTSTVLRCADGYVALSINQTAQWDAWMEVLGQPEWAASPLFVTRMTRAEHWDALQPLIEEVTETIPKHEIVRKAQDLGVPCTPVMTFGQLLSDEHLQERGFWTTHSFGGKEWKAPNMRSFVVQASEKEQTDRNLERAD